MVKCTLNLTVSDLFRIKRLLKEMVDGTEILTGYPELASALEESLEKLSNSGIHDVPGILSEYNIMVQKYG